MPDQNSGCWLWLGDVVNGGYGRLTWGKKNRIRAHRLAWLLANKSEIPHGMEIMHKCDTPPCINPAHLRLGTQHDNMLDKAAKGRHHNQKLTRSQVLEICAAPGSLRKIGARFGISAQHAMRLKRAVSYS